MFFVAEFSRLRNKLFFLYIFEATPKKKLMLMVLFLSVLFFHQFTKSFWNVFEDWLLFFSFSASYCRPVIIRFVENANLWNALAGITVTLWILFLASIYPGRRVNVEVLGRLL